MLLSLHVLDANCIHTLGHFANLTMYTAGNGGGHGDGSGDDSSSIETESEHGNENGVGDNESKKRTKYIGHMAQ